MLKKGEKFDRTDLDIPRAYRRGLIHRDYIAHCFRWSFVKRFIIGRDAWFCKSKDRAVNFRWRSANILDVGCGKDLMLYATLNSNKVVPQSYTGVDINKLEVLEEFSGSRLKPTLLGETDFCSIESLDQTPNIVTCFEVLEHVPYEHAGKMLKKMYDISDDRSYAIISTPVYNEKYGMADNHINEMTREQLIKLIDIAGWEIKENYGAFGGRPEMKDYIEKKHLDLWNRLTKYYNSDVLSTFLAPLYPELARNNVWILRKGFNNQMKLL